jgi:hypothetical protein
MVYMVCNRNYMIDRSMTSKSWNNIYMTSKSRCAFFLWFSYAVINLKIVNIYKPWFSMKILMLLHDFDVIYILFHDVKVPTKNVPPLPSRVELNWMGKACGFIPKRAGISHINMKINYAKALSLYIIPHLQFM